MWLTRLDVKIGWLLFCDYVAEMRSSVAKLREDWEKCFHLTHEQLGTSPLAPGYVKGYVK